MTIEPETIAQLIKKSIPDAEIQIADLRGDGKHHAAYIVSSSFAGKTRVEQHRMVYDALKSRTEEELHALAIQTAVP